MNAVDVMYQNYSANWGPTIAPSKSVQGVKKHTQPSTSVLKHKACDTCKRRKVRCSGEEPCSNCQRNGATCSYTSSERRLAEAQRRLTSCHKKLRSIELAWHRFMPDIDLSLAVHTIENEATASIDTVQIEASEFQPSSPNMHALEDVLAAIPAQKDNSSAGSATEQELELERADALEWDESADMAEIADGIGSLSVDRKGVGYMGPQSGNAVLRSLESSSILIGRFNDLSLPKFSPQPEIPDNIIRSTEFRTKCLDYFFRYFNNAYPILHEGYFRAQYSGVLPKPKDGSWPVLSNIVLALGAFTSDISNQNADIYFYREASKGLSLDISHRGSLSLVQALALMANYLQKRNKPNSGFTFLGIAMNMSQGIGLHREFAESSFSAFMMEIRRRVWWTLFIFDSGARLTFGRPTLNLEGINVRLPQNLDDTDLSVDLDELPPTRDVPTLTSSLIWQTKLAKLSNLANERLLEARTPNEALMVELENKILQWQRNMPPYMQAGYYNPEHEAFDVPRMVLLWRSMHLRIIIHRPFVLDLIKRRQSLDLSRTIAGPRRCIEASRECISSIVSFWDNSNKKHGAFVWYAFYWLVTAAFVPVTCLLYEPQNESAMEWRLLIDSSRRVLEALGAFEPTAFRAARIIDEMMGLVPSSPDSTTFAMNEPMRMEFAEIWNQSWADIVIPQESTGLDFLM